MIIINLNANFADLSFLLQSLINKKSINYFQLKNHLHPTLFFSPFLLKQGNLLF